MTEANTFEKFWERATHNTYPTAAAIVNVEKYENGKKLRPLSERWFYSVQSLVQIAWSTSKVVFVLVLPYVLVLLLCVAGAILMYYSPYWFVVILVTEMSLNMLYTLMYNRTLYSLPMELIDSFISPEPKITITAGLYFDQSSSKMKQILGKCKSLTSRFATESSLYVDNDGKNGQPLVHRASSGFLSGGMRSVLPFALFHPPIIQYRRRWLRVPIARGPREGGRADANADAQCDAEFESVAVDWSPALGSRLLGHPAVADESKSPNPNHNLESKTVYLILAGLTGGSQEGYILDFVHHANFLGHDCFVMIARGLEESTPCHSCADFHGARLTDAETAARAIRRCLDQTGQKYSLFMVGFSLGAIIVSNLISKGCLLKPTADSPGERSNSNSNGMIVNGAVALAGSLDAKVTLQNQYALTYWLPVLAFGLKDMVSNSYGNMAKSARRLYAHLKDHSPRSFGSEEEKQAHEQTLYLDFLRREVDSVCDFDALHLARYHGFRDVLHYYQEMTSEVRDLEQCATPLLVINAMDDPVLHINTVSNQIPKNFASFHDNEAENAANNRNRARGKSDTGSNFCCLITTTGGHVGWPVGSVLTGEATKHKWKFSSSLVTEFCAAIPMTTDE